MKYWTQVLGSEIMPWEILERAAEDCETTVDALGVGQLAAWIEEQSEDIWGNEHDPDDDYIGMADQIIREAQAHWATE